MRTFDPFHISKVYAISKLMSNEQHEYIIWLLKLIGVGLWGPFVTNILNWLTKSELASIINLLISIILAISGCIILFVAYNRIKERKNANI